MKEPEEETGGDRRKPGPPVDRWLIRTKDALIIAGASFAIIKWLYVNPIQQQDRTARVEQIQAKQQETLEKIATSLEVQTAKLGDLNKNFQEFQRSFYSKKPGGWTYEDERWKWDVDDKKTRR